MNNCGQENKIHSLSVIAFTLLNKSLQTTKRGNLNFAIYSATVQM